MQLVIRQPGEPTRTVPLVPTEGKRLRFGAGPGADVVLTGHGIEPVHCGISWKRDHFELIASKAAKKLIYNGLSVGGARLRDGDVFQVGDFEIAVADPTEDDLGLAPLDDSKPGTATGVAKPAGSSPVPPGPVAAEDELELVPLDIDAPPPGKPGSEKKPRPVQPVKPAGKQPSGKTAFKPAAGQTRPPSAWASQVDSSTNAAAGKGKKISSTGSLFDSAVPALAAEIVGPPLSGAGLADSLATLPLDSPAASPGGPPPAEVSDWRQTLSRRVLKRPAPLIAVVLAGLVGWFALTRPSAEQQFDRAQRDYAAGAFAEAADRFEAFLARYPDHAGSGQARARAELARLRLLAAEGNWPAVLDSAKQTLARFDWAFEQIEDRQSLGELLAKTAAGLAAEAQAAAAGDPAQRGPAVERIRDAVALVYGHVPPPLANTQLLREALSTVARLDRQRDREETLRAAFSKIGEAGVYAVRRELVRTHPRLAVDPELTKALVAATRVQAGRVSYETLDRGPLTSEAASALPGGASFASRRGPPTGAASEVVFALSQATGSAYALDAATGDPLWRRFVGFDTSFVPLACSGALAGKALLVDSTRSELVCVESASGKLVWRAPLEPFDAAPLVFADRALVACLNGELVEIDLATGGLRSKFVVPQPLICGPLFDADKRLLYQLAAQSTLYVLSESNRKCLATVYLGHDRSTIVAPPVRFDEWLLVAENNRIETATLHVLQTGSGSPSLVQSLPLAGQVVAGIVVHQGHAYVPLVGGGLQTFAVAPSSDRGPLKAGPSIEPRQGSTAVGFAAIAGGRLWLGSEGLGLFDLPLENETARPRRLFNPEAVFQEPLAAVGPSTILVRSPRDSDRLIVAAVEPFADSVTWETRLASPVVAALDVSGKAIHVLEQSGNLFTVETAQLRRQPRVYHEPSATVELSGPLDDATAITWPDGLVLFVGGPGSKEMVLFEPDMDVRQAWKLPLPRPLADRPVRFGKHLLVALERGPVYLLDPRSGLPAGQPFQPPIEPMSAGEWRIAAVDDGSAAVLYDGQRTMYHLGRDAGDHLDIQAELQLDQMILSSLLVVDGLVWGVDDQRNLKSWRLPGLDQVASLPLSGDVTWGPAVAESRVLLATDDDQLWCVAGGVAGSKGLVWQVPLPYGTPAAVAAGQQGQEYVFASPLGDAWALDATNGGERWHVATGQPLANGILPTPREMVLTTLDGTIALLTKDK